MDACAERRRDVHASERGQPRTLPPGSPPHEGDVGTGNSSSSIDDADDEVWTLARNANGTYSPANAVNQGRVASRARHWPVTGGTWDGLQLVILDRRLGDEVWTLRRRPDSARHQRHRGDACHHRPQRHDAAHGHYERPEPRRHAQLSVGVGQRRHVRQRHVAQHVVDGGSGMTGAHAAECTLTVSDQTGRSAMASVTVTVREMGAPPLALPAIADKTGETGDVVDVVIAAATNGRAPYTYAYANLPEELTALGRRIRGRLITPGTETVTVTVTDSNGDTASQDFDWVVTGRPSRRRRRQRAHRLGAGRRSATPTPT